MTDIKTLTTLEFDKVLESVSKFCMSKGGQKLIKKLIPETNLSDVKNALDLTEEAIYLYYNQAVILELTHEDIAEILEKANVQGALSARDLLDIARVLKVSRQAKQQIESVGGDKTKLLKEITNDITALSDLESDIEKSIVSENEIADNASFDLKEIRRAKAGCSVKLRKILNNYISSSTYSKALQENIVTIRNGRYVLPVKSECKNQVPGLVHDQSSTGKALFIEPFDVVQANNELTELCLNESREIERILKAFTVRVKSDVQAIERNSKKLIELDSVFAKAAYTHKNKCAYPSINESGIIKIINGRHPLIDKEKVVPVSLNIDKNEQILLITGPNTGGKTVSLKLTGLLTLMTMCGIFPPLDDGSVINIYSSIYADIGDRQSIENSLSTFSSHLSNIIDITDNVDCNSLVLLDELGGGTDPGEGSALAVAILKHLIDVGATAIITTHYRQLKDFALSDNRIKCASMDFDAVTYAPTYKLIMNSTGGSKALKIAERLGLKSEILKNAYLQIAPEERTLNELLEAAEAAKSQSEKELEKIISGRKNIEYQANNLKKLEAQYNEKLDKLENKLKAESRKLLNEYIDDADDLIDEIKELVKKGDEESLFKARNIKSKLSYTLDYKSVPRSKTDKTIDKTPIHAGDCVYVKSIKKVGVVSKIYDKKKQYEVKLGALSSTVKYDDVEKRAREEYSIAQADTTVRLVQDEKKLTESVPLELDVRGQQSEEALFNIGNYLNRCVMHGYKEVRIVHGKGSGILRRAVAEYFKSHPNVDTFRLGKYGEGDDGVTIAVLK